MKLKVCLVKSLVEEGWILESTYDDVSLKDEKDHTERFLSCDVSGHI